MTEASKMVEGLNVKTFTVLVNAVNIKKYMKVDYSGKSMVWCRDGTDCYRSNCIFVHPCSPVNPCGVEGCTHSPKMIPQCSPTSPPLQAQLEPTFESAFDSTRSTTDHSTHLDDLCQVSTSVTDSLFRMCDVEERIEQEDCSDRQPPVVLPEPEQTQSKPDPTNLDSRVLCEITSKINCDPKISPTKSKKPSPKSKQQRKLRKQKKQIISSHYVARQFPDPTPISSQKEPTLTKPAPKKTPPKADSEWVVPSRNAKRSRTFVSQEKVSSQNPFQVLGAAKTKSKSTNQSNRSKQQSRPVHLCHSHSNNFAAIAAA